MIALELSLRSILFIGSDRDRALINGTKKHFLIAKNLFCVKHVEDDIKRKLSSMHHISGKVKEIMLYDMFGSDLQQIKGLIDCKDESSFDALSYSMCNKWDQLESSCGANIRPQFSQYFIKYIEKDMKEGMILGILQKACLGDDFFCNNQTESIHFRFKNKIRELKMSVEISGKPSKKCTFTEAIAIYEEMLQMYTRNAERALVGTGPYQLATDYARFFLASSNWSQMRPSERKLHVHKFSKASHLEKTTDSQLQENFWQESSFTLESIEVIDLPIESGIQNGQENTEILNLSLSGLSENYRVDWDGARALVISHGLMKSPWADSSYIVSS